MDIYVLVSEPTEIEEFRFDNLEDFATVFPRFTSHFMEPFKADVSFTIEVRVEQYPLYIFVDFKP